ncbi:NUMOD4 domain-containing protein [Terribacillus sp. DMT04]|jgi:NUMOD4 motif|uniref:NUMOD4 domain-containing protein n=1 Tax=Terribacillus sp. DMT04 TaxID=2850441 RepID=UPI001C2C1B27|nr:NUMOD4 domain-containing protein [Terribacillus sp. DMT04]QXE03195.1 hypothetical protein KS242_08510 [Terribacillus sp. DMT04]
MDKEYRPVPGYKGLYEIAVDGSVRSLDRIGVDGRRLQGQDMLGYGKPNGYASVKLTKDGKSISHNVKKLIEKTFG